MKARFYCLFVFFLISTTQFSSATEDVDLSFDDLFTSDSEEEEEDSPSIFDDPFESGSKENELTSYLKEEEEHRRNTEKKLKDLALKKDRALKSNPGNIRLWPNIIKRQYQGTVSKTKEDYFSSRDHYNSKVLVKRILAFSQGIKRKKSQLFIHEIDAGFGLNTIISEAFQESHPNKWKSFESKKKTPLEIVSKYPKAFENHFNQMTNLESLTENSIFIPKSILTKLKPCRSSNEVKELIQVLNLFLRLEGQYIALVLKTKLNEIAPLLKDYLNQNFVLSHSHYTLELTSPFPDEEKLSLFFFTKKYSSNPIIN